MDVTYKDAIEYFYINNKNKTDGLYPYCIKCTKNSVKK